MFLKQRTHFKGGDSGTRIRPGLLSLSSTTTSTTTTTPPPDNSSRAILCVSPSTLTHYLNFSNFSLSHTLALKNYSTSSLTLAYILELLRSRHSFD